MIQPIIPFKNLNFESTLHQSKLSPINDSTPQKSSRYFHFQNQDGILKMRPSTCAQNQLLSTKNNNNLFSNQNNKRRINFSLEVQSIENSSPQNYSFRQKSMISKTEQISGIVSPLDQYRPNSQQQTIKEKDDPKKTNILGGRQFSNDQYKRSIENDIILSKRSEDLIKINKIPQLRLIGKNTTVQDSSKNKLIITSPRDEDLKSYQFRNTFNMIQNRMNKKAFQVKDYESFQKPDEKIDESQKQRRNNLSNLRDKTRNLFLNSFKKNLEEEIKVKMGTKQQLQISELQCNQNKLIQRYKVIKQSRRRQASSNQADNNNNSVDQDCTLNNDLDLSYFTYKQNQQLIFNNSIKNKSFSTSRFKDDILNGIQKQKDISPIKQFEDNFFGMNSQIPYTKEKEISALPTELENEKTILEEISQFSTKMKEQKHFLIKNQKIRHFSKGFCGITKQENEMLLTTEGFKKIKEKKHNPSYPYCLSFDPF